MNSYYIAAIVCTALTAYFGYLGASYESKSDSEQQTTKIEGQLKELGSKIELLSTGDPTHKVTSSDLSNIQKEFNAIAEDFYKNLPIELEHQKNKTSTKTISQLELSRRIEPHFDSFQLSAKQLVEAFNKHRQFPPIQVSFPDFPTNVFQAEKYRALLIFPNSKYWSVKLMKITNENLMIQFSVSESVRLDNGRQDFLDLGHFVSLVFSPDLSTFTFFNDLSQEMKDRIVGGIPDKQYDLEKFDETAKTLVERIIKYEILEESLKS